MKPTRLWVALLVCQLLFTAAQAKPAPRKDLQQNARPAAAEKPQGEPASRQMIDPRRQCLTECWLVARRTPNARPS
ncbi:MAG: hypothetical protein JWQ76_2424 [Ramlibacter sp.]|nr:hypothetical protein [Ramlibacter sp.]